MDKLKDNKNLKGNAFIPTEEGSARRVNLDGKGIFPKYKNEITKSTKVERGAPWSREQSLKQLCEEVEVDMDDLIQGIEDNKSDMELANDMGVSEKTVNALRKQFMRYGIASIEGQD